jgi:hypothetical protein
MLPDLDGDGHDELLIGVPRDGTAAPSAGAVRIVSGASGLAIDTVRGDAQDDYLGWAVEAVGDVDADGTVDFGAGAPSQCGTGKIGYARVFSGADFSVLATVHGDSYLDWFGCALSGAGDQDLDGHADFAVGAYSFCGGFKLPGYVRAYSGATGLARWTAMGDSDWDSFGWALDLLGDYDGDGVEDLIAGAPGNDTKGYDAGRFYVLSGTNGAKLYTEDGEAGLHYSGFALVGTGDLDLDGVVDYSIGVPGEQDGFGDDPHPSEFGKIQLHSAATHTVLFETVGPAVFDHLGWAVATVGDLDQDGHPEVAAAATRFDIATTQLSFGPAYIDVVSGATGETVLHVEGPVTAENHEVDLASGGDVNGDGSPDLVLGSNGLELTGGFARVLSTRALELASTTFLLTPAGGKDSVQYLPIDLPPEYAGSFYRILGSQSGTSPGFDLGGVHVPLNPDEYTDVTLDPLSGSLMKHGKGLVGTIKPLATFKPSTAQIATMAGETLHHVLVVFDSRGVPISVSAPVPVTVLP